MCKVCCIALIAVIAASPAFAQRLEWCGAAYQSFGYRCEIEDPALCEDFRVWDSLERQGEPRIAGLFRRQIRCDRQLARAEVSYSSRFTGDMIEVETWTRIEVASEVPVADGSVMAQGSAYFVGEFCVLRPDEFQIIATGSLQTSFGNAVDDGDFGFLGVVIRSAEENEAFEPIYIDHALYNTGETHIDTVLALTSGRFLVEVDQETFRLRQDPNSENVAEVAVASVRLSILPRTCPTDINFDRRVDSTDLAILLSNLYGFGGRTHGNLTGSPFIDLEDLALLLAHYGEACTATTTP